MSHRSAESDAGSLPAHPRRLDPPEDFPVTWPDPQDAELMWTHETEHSSPLVLPCHVAQRHWLADGMTAAARLYGAPLAGRRGVRINTYWYDTTLPLDAPPEDLARRAREGEALKAERGEDLARWWEERWQPELAQLLQHWAAADPDAWDDAALADWLVQSEGPFRRMWEIHFELVLCLFPTITAFGELAADLFGSDDDPISGHELLVGEGNATLQASLALWDLSRTALGHPEVLAALEERDPAAAERRLAGSAAGQAFWAAFRIWLSEYGQRPDERREALGANWDENPTVPLAMLRAHLEAPASHPLDGWRRRRAAREARTAEARQRLADYPAAVRTAFEDQLSRARYATKLVEDHNFHLDQKSFYWYRRAVLAAGQRLAQRGHLDRPQDVAFLEFGEVVQALAAGADGNRLRQQAASERAALERWASVSPPDRLGTERPSGLPTAPAAAPGPADGRWHGVPASPGLVQGRARVAPSLAEASEVQPGDILVTVTTNPSWAPLFPVLGGLVTTVGSPLSHGAIVAREFGLPAVLAVASATAIIRTGDWLEVDGLRGTVTPIEEPG